MKKVRIFTLVLLAAFASAHFLAAGLAVPPGAMVKLHVRSVPAAAALWADASFREAWTDSVAAKVMERSRIALKLQDLGSKLDEVLGETVDLSFLVKIGCTELTAAVYDPGRREALVVARVTPAGLAAATALVAGYPAITRFERPCRFKAAKGLFGFGLVASGDLLCLATTERLLGEAARLLAQGGGEELPASFAGGAADFVLDVDLDAVRKTPYYRKYWIFGRSGELNGKARLLSAIRREGDGWVEERVFQDARGPLPVLPPMAAATAAPADAPPFWMIRKAPPEKLSAALLVGGVLAVPASRRKDLEQPKYTGAAFGTARSEESDFDLTVDKPAEPAAAGLPKGFLPPAGELEALLGRLDVQTLRWAWDLAPQQPGAGLPGREGALVLECRSGGDHLGELRQALTRIIAAAYLCSAADVAWAPATGGGQWTGWPRPLYLSSPRPGVVTAATSPAMMAQAAGLLRADAPNDFAAALRLGEAGTKYRNFLQTAGLAAGSEEEGLYRFMEDIVPSVLDVAAGVREIRKERGAFPGGVWERLTYR